MAYFPTEFVDIARNPGAEALRVRLHVRLNDGASGSPGTLLSITDNQEILQISQIERRREYSFGVIQGQDWQIQVTNNDLAMLAYSLPGCWACIEGGFPGADEWVVFAQGKIKTFQTEVGGTVTLEIRDSIMDVLDFSLQRDVRFQLTGWVSEMKLVRQDEDSSGWDSAVDIVSSSPAVLDDETFVVVFTNDEDFEVRHETPDGTVMETGTISASLEVENWAGSNNAITIPTTGWTQGAGNYTAGDTFEIHTARPRTTDELSPVNMVRHLIEEVAGLTCYDVLNGVEYSSPIYDSTNWTELGADGAGHTIAGKWSKGAALSQLIQDALKIVHGTIYPAPLGQVALWVLQPATAGALTLNGDPGAGPVDILDGSGYTDSLEDTITDVAFEYLTLGTAEEASYPASVPLDESPLLKRRQTTIIIGWEVRGLSIESACNLYLLRNQSEKRIFHLKCTLAGAVADIAGTVAIREAAVGVAMAVVSTTGVIIDLLENSAEVKAHNDPFVSQGFFIIGESLIGGPGVLR